jgi:DNA repair protein RadC
MATIDETTTGHRKRLRERFSRALLDGFHDYEIIELLLTYSIPRRDVKPAAKELIRQFGGLKGIFDATIEELTDVKGIGGNTALVIKLLKGTAREYLKERSTVRTIIRLPKDAVDFVAPEAGAPEALFAVYLNSKNEVLGVEVLHEGGLKSIKVSPRAAIEKAFKHNARSIIFVHNLADGNGTVLPVLGEAEMKLVRAFENAASAIDIIVHDHIVVGDGAHLSARESGALKKA